MPPPRGAEHLQNDLNPKVPEAVLASRGLLTEESVTQGQDNISSPSFFLRQRRTSKTQVLADS